MNRLGTVFRKPTSGNSKIKSSNSQLENKLSPLIKLPTELFHKIFSYLDLCDLENISLTSKLNMHQVKSLSFFQGSSCASIYNFSLLLEQIPRLCIKNSEIGGKKILKLELPRNSKHFVDNLIAAMTRQIIAPAFISNVNINIRPLLKNYINECFTAGREDIDKQTFVDIINFFTNFSQKDLSIDKLKILLAFSKTTKLREIIQKDNNFDKFFIYSNHEIINSLTNYKFIRNFIINNLSKCLSIDDCHEQLIQFVFTNYGDEGMSFLEQYLPEIKQLGESEVHKLIEKKELLSILIKLNQYDPTSNIYIADNIAKYINDELYKQVLFNIHTKLLQENMHNEGLYNKLLITS